MLLRFDSLNDLDFPRLMEIYRESNTENISYFYPDCTDKEAGRKQVEERFRAYLKDDFFAKPGNRYYVFEKDGVWLTAIYHPSALLRDLNRRPETFLDLLNIRDKIRQVCPEVYQ